MFEFSGSFKAVMPFKIPEELKEEFVTETAQTMVTTDDFNHVTDDGGYNFSHELMVVLASK